jgi:FtsH-binding integral membrane protein
MQDYTRDYQSLAAAQAVPADRATFIRRTYAHLAAALGLLAFLEAALIHAGIGDAMLSVLGGSRFGWLIVMVAFMAVSWIADKWARSDTSQNMQYAGLGLYVVAQAVIFLPMLTLAARWAPDVIGQAAVLTGALVAALTAVAFITRKDFSFLRPVLVFGGLVALGVIVASILFGFTLGTIFSGVMILFAGASVLYSTSNILHHYRVDQHVAASLSLFASVALLFLYILRLLMSMRSN